MPAPPVEVVPPAMLMPRSLDPVAPVAWPVIEMLPVVAVMLVLVK